MDEIGSIIQRLEQQQASIERAISALREISKSGGTSLPVTASTPSGPRKRILSEAGRKRIADAARKRWAQLAKDRGQAPKSAAKKSGGGITPAGRKKLAEMMRKRWAAKRAEGTQPTASSKKKQLNNKAA